MKNILSIKTLLLANAVLTIFGGLNQLIVPRQWVGSFIPNVRTDQGAALVAQFLGTVVISFGIVALITWRTKDRTTLLALLTGFALENMGSLGLAIYGISTGMMNSHAVGDLVFHGSSVLLFAACLVYVLMRPRSAETPQKNTQKSEA